MPSADAQRFFATAAPHLEALLGERFSTAPSVLEQHGRDESWHPVEPPQGVCFAQSTEEVAQIVRLCADHRLPVIPFGAGTSLEGQIGAPRGGISLDLSPMDRIVALRPEDLDATVEAGVTRLQLDRVARDQGLFFPVDPGADATFGGMTATRASGTSAVRYGTMRENVLALEVVLASGEVIHTGRRSRKSSAGYDLTRLFVGSEGTLGVITQVTVRLHGLPEAIAAAVVPFDDLRGAVETAATVVQMGLPVARVELLDEVMVDAVNRHAGSEHTVAPTLFFEFHGTEAGVEEQSREVGDVVRQHGGGEFRWARQEDERQALWHARHHAYYAALALRPGARGWTTDVCVPLSHLAQCLVDTRRDIDASVLQAPIVGHVGDGNFHLLMLVDPDSADELAEAERLHDRLVARALDLEGTCTGEHGVGVGKKKFLPQEHGEVALDAMRALKHALDPHGLMNPGKIF